MTLIFKILCWTEIFLGFITLVMLPATGINVLLGVSNVILGFGLGEIKEETDEVQKR